MQCMHFSVETPFKSNRKKNMPEAQKKQQQEKEEEDRNFQLVCVVDCIVIAYQNILCAKHRTIQKYVFDMREYMLI